LGGFFLMTWRLTLCPDSHFVIAFSSLLSFFVAMFLSRRCNRDQPFLFRVSLSSMILSSLCFQAFGVFFFLTPGRTLWYRRSPLFSHPFFETARLRSVLPLLVVVGVRLVLLSAFDFQPRDPPSYAFSALVTFFRLVGV